MHNAYVERLINLVDSDANVLLNLSAAAAEQAVASGDPQQVAAIQGQFAIVQKAGRTVRMARSIGRPMRYFLAKQADGPLLLVAERIDQIKAMLEQEGYADQFHPSYTRMVPAHHLLEIELVGCPDPNPRYQRFLAPPANRLPADLDVIGKTYVQSICAVCDQWLDTVGADAPIGLLFSGGIDSGALLLILHHLLLQRGQAPTRLKALTLSIDGGADAVQAAEFLRQVSLGMLWERIDLPPAAVNVAEAVAAIEDYKPLDVQAAAMTLALCKELRRRYPDWTYLVDGDGGDENLKDYPIEDNPELTIRSVLNNRMLYQEGWGVDAIKHSLTYSGGQSRGHVRSYAPGRTLGFHGFSPYAVPQVIAVAEGIPFIELTNWQHERLYALKGEVMRRGVEALTGQSMPVFPKRRFQHGAVDSPQFSQLFPAEEQSYRQTFLRLHA